MKFILPTVGSVVQLIEPWTFLVRVISLNEDMFIAIGNKYLSELPWPRVKQYHGGTEFTIGKLDFLRNKPAFIETYRNAAEILLMPKTKLRIEKITIRSDEPEEFLRNTVFLSVVETNHPLLLANMETLQGKLNFTVTITDFMNLNCEIIDEQY